ncbi:hypothetical protein DAPPUDRAFT_319214 [Daphnia pulex]|uniref:N-acetyltransferase domain-containing protein n=1 Tax=Daphnia pulex TaxID=6669 RepID=E9GL13_DAPPU|nr:hypothetical protein DAPPUDRAFT_319214 [Daphnia pulex]|eukprot:EFX79773.1 hypothetical protein DAPPUDRAFT_319214 [Daphnia pulex]
MNSFPRNFAVEDGRTFTIDLARLDDLAEVVEFRKQHFNSISPACYLVNVANNETIDIDKRVRESTLKNLSSCEKNPVSLTMRDSTGRLVAIALNKLIEKPQADDQAAPLPAQENPILIVSLIIDDLERGIDLFTTYNTKTIFELWIMSVDKTYGQLGIATALASLSLDLAKANNAGAVKCLAVSQYSAKAAAKNGLETIRTIDYATYEFNGDKPLANLTDLLAEHPVARLMARRI